MILRCVHLLIKILIVVNVCDGQENINKQSDELKVKELLPDIYAVYLDAIKQDQKNITRRVYKNDEQYTLHIQKLREVNGVKTHNIHVAKVLRTEDPLIYINNPVESHIPNAFLTQEQFMEHLKNNIKQQHTELELQKIKNFLNKFSTKAKKKLEMPVIWRLPNISVLFKTSLKSDEKKTTTDNAGDNPTLNEDILSSGEISTNAKNAKSTFRTSADKDTKDPEPQYSEDITEGITTTVVASTTEDTTMLTTVSDADISPDVTEVPETTMSTQSTRKTRGRPYVFMGDAFEKMQRENRRPKS